MNERSITERQMIEKAFEMDDNAELALQRTDEHLAQSFRDKARAIRCALTECFPDYLY
jgi:hypothetical protein